MNDADPTRKDGLGSRFWSLWAAVATTNLADGLSLVAFPLLAVELTDDARLVALITMFRFLPFLVIGLPAGVLLDRVDRRNVSIAAQVGRATMMGIVAVVVFAGAASIGLIAAAAFVIGVGEVLTDGGLPALIRDMVRSDQLEVANSRVMGTQVVSNVFIGPPVGAVLYELDPGLPFVGSVLLFAGAIGLLFRVPARARDVDPAGQPEAAGSAEDGVGPARRVLGEISVGLRYVWSHPILRPLAFAVMAFSFVGQAANSVFVLLVTERYLLGGVGFGAVISVRGATSFIMSFYVARVVTRTSHGFSMQIAIVAFLTASLLFGFTTVVPALVIGSVIQAIGDPSWNVVSSTVRQRLVPDEVFGRMMTAYLFIAWSMNPVGALVGGLIAERWGPQWVSVMAAAVVGSLLVLVRSLFRGIDEVMAETTAA